MILPLSLQEHLIVTGLSGSALFFACIFLFSAHTSANSGRFVALRYKLGIAVAFSIGFLGFKYYEWLIWWFSDSGTLLPEVSPGSVVFAHSILVLLGMWGLTGIASVHYFRSHWNLAIPLQASSWGAGFLTLLWGLMLWQGYR